MTMVDGVSSCRRYREGRDAGMSHWSACRTDHVRNCVGHFNVKKKFFSTTTLVLGFFAACCVAFEDRKVWRELRSAYRFGHSTETAIANRLTKTTLLCEYADDQLTSHSTDKCSPSFCSQNNAGQLLASVNY